jgi:protein-S-isoprenylcysteine O-methyltransferase Ste14
MSESESKWYPEGPGRAARPKKANWILAGLVCLVGVVAFVVAIRSGRRDSALLFVGLPVLLAVALVLTPGRTTHGRVFQATTVVLLLDPPVRLVTTGPYAYLANPMQVSAAALLGLLAAVAGSVSLALTAASAGAFSAAVARPHEQNHLAHRYGQRWRAYRADVRDWWPRRAPYPAGFTAVLWLDLDCGPCTAVAAFLRRRSPRQLTLAPAGDHHPPLRRARYLGDDGHDQRGGAAVARALEHVNIGWAYVGWVLRAPGIGWLAQLVTDAMIAPPHPATPTAEGDRHQPTANSGCSTEHCGPSASTASPASPPAPSPPRPA